MVSLPAEYRYMRAWVAFFSPSKAGIYYSDIPEGESQASSDTSLSAVAFYLPYSSYSRIYTCSECDRIAHCWYISLDFEQGNLILLECQVLNAQTSRTCITFMES